MSQEIKTVTKEEVENAMKVMDTSFSNANGETMQKLIEVFIRSEEFKTQALEAGISEETVIAMQVLATPGADAFVTEIIAEEDPTGELQAFLSSVEDEDDFSDKEI